MVMSADRHTIAEDDVERTRSADVGEGPDSTRLNVVVGGRRDEAASRGSRVKSVNLTDNRILFSEFGEIGGSVFNVERERSDRHERIVSGDGVRGLTLSSGVGDSGGIGVISGQDGAIEILGRGEDSTKTSTINVSEGDGSMEKLRIVLHEWADVGKPLIFRVSGGTFETKEFIPGADGSTIRIGHVSISGETE
jgi:hypothetical protein